MYEGNQNFDKDGWLVLGFNGHQPECADGYTSTGSLYMATLSFLPLGLPDGGQGRGGLGAGLLLRADRRRPHRRLSPRRQQRVCRWLRLHHHLHPKGRAGGGGDGAGRADPELNRNIPGADRL